MRQDLNASKTQFSVTAFSFCPISGEASLSTPELGLHSETSFQTDHSFLDFLLLLTAGQGQLRQPGSLVTSWKFWYYFKFHFSFIHKSSENLGPLLPISLVILKCYC